jgi:hypothetical protein
LTPEESHDHQQARYPRPPLDRLERAGYAQRVPDPGDRRKVIVKPDESKVEQELLPRFAQLNSAARVGFYERYNDDELAAIGDFLARLGPETAPCRQLASAACAYPRTSRSAVCRRSTVADLLGHARLDTVRAYTRPTDDDRPKALNVLPTDR